MTPSVFEKGGLFHWALTKSLSGDENGMNELRLVAFRKVDVWVPLRTTAWVQGHMHGMPNCLWCVRMHAHYENAFAEARRIGGGVPASLHRQVFGEGTPLWSFE